MVKVTITVETDTSTVTVEERVCTVIAERDLTHLMDTTQIIMKVAERVAKAIVADTTAGTEGTITRAGDSDRG